MRVVVEKEKTFLDFRMSEEILAIEKDFPFVRTIDTRQHPKKGRLASAVDADDAKNGSLLDGDVDFPQDWLVAQSLADFLRFKHLVSPFTNGLFDFIKSVT